MKKEKCLLGCLKENKIRRHAGRFLSGISSLQKQQSGLRSPTETFGDDIFIYHGGFTLIELLVVVLIIGILAAVALPQYQKAVEKSRAAQAITLIRSIGEAGEAYHLASGEWPSSFDEIGIEPPSWTGTTKGYTNAGASDAVSNSDWSLQWWSSGNGSSGIVITRMTGPYAGAGFTWAFERNDALVPTKQVVCTERLANGVTFSGTAGDYCQKLFRGTLKATFEHRFYALP